MKKMFFLISGILILIALALFFTRPSDELFLKTSDGILISANFLPSNSTEAVILLHMLGSNKESYRSLERILNKRFATLSIDLRGHGKSDGDWHSFNEKDFINMEKDVLAAKEFLKKKGLITTYIVGASIGANLALREAAKDSEISGVVLLSPGLNYRGIDIEPAIKKFRGRILIIVGNEDSYSVKSSEKIFSEVPAKRKEFLKMAGDAHGTRLLSDSVIKKISNFIV